MRLSHNMSSLNIYTGYANAINRRNESLGRISSGVKIAGAKDSPVGLAKSEKMDIQIRGLQMANRNMQDAASMLQTAEGGLNEITSSLQRIRELTVQARNGTNNDNDKAVIQSEIDQMVKSVDELSAGTTFNGINLINGNKASDNSIQLAIGANPFDTMEVPTFNFSSKTLGVNGKYVSDINVITDAGADSAINVVDAALSDVITARSKYGALENRFETGQQQTDELSDRVTEAYSDVVDTDLATEMVEYSKDGIIADASTAMIAQTNKFPQDILRILQNVK